MTLVQQLIQAGYPREDMYNHESDLYVYVTPLTTQVIKDWCHGNDLDTRLFMRRFKDNITGRPMYDIPFQADWWWREKSKESAGNAHA